MDYWLTGLLVQQPSSSLSKKKIREPAGRTEPSRASFWPTTVQDFGLGLVLHYLGPSRVWAEPALDRAEPKARNRCPALASTTTWNRVLEHQQEAQWLSGEHGRAEEPRRRSSSYMPHRSSKSSRVSCGLRDRVDGWRHT
jgi:hypothetical protein